MTGKGLMKPRVVKPVVASKKLDVCVEGNGEARNLQETHHV